MFLFPISGSKRIQSDFEFILGRKLPILYILLWWLCPFLLSGIFIWSLATLVHVTGYLMDDPIWLYATGWSVVLLAVMFILVMGLCQASKQDDYYTFSDVSSDKLIITCNHWEEEQFCEYYFFKLRHFKTDNFIPKNH